MWKFKVPRLTPEETFSKRLIELFAVNQTDVNAFLGVVNSTRTLLAQHAQETATIVHADAASVVLTVPPTEQAQKIHDVLMALIQDVLQKDHAAASQLLEEDEVKNAFGGFGADQRNITVRLNSRADGSATLLISEIRVGSKGSTSTRVVGVPRDGPYPDDLAWLTRFQSNFGVLQPAFNAGIPIASGAK